MFTKKHVTVHDLQLNKWCTSSNVITVAICSHLSKCSGVLNGKVGVAWLIYGMRTWIGCILSLIHILIHFLHSMTDFATPIFTVRLNGK